MSHPFIKSIRFEPATAEYTAAVRDEADAWVPAGAGLETPFVALDGSRWLYVFNPAKREHGYLNLDTDLVQESPPSGH